MAIETLRPNAAGDECNIDAEAGAACPSHYQNVDEITSDGVTTMVNTTSVTWLRDLYGIENSAGSGTINFVKVYAVCADGSPIDQASLKIAIKSGTTVAESAEKTITGAWVTYSNQWNTNPDTATAWTWSEIDNLQAGIALRRPRAAVVQNSYCTQVYVEVDYVTSTPQTVGDGAIAVAGSLGLLTKIAVGAGSISIAGVLTSVLTFFKTVGSGSISIAGALSSTLTIFQAVGSGAISIASTLGRYIKIAVGAGATTIAGSLALKTILSVGGGSVAIAGALGASLVTIIQQVVGMGSVVISGTLGRKILLSVGNGAVTIVSSLIQISEWIKLTLLSRVFGFTLKPRTVSLTLQSRSLALTLQPRTLDLTLSPRSLSLTLKAR